MGMCKPSGGVKEVFGGTRIQTHELAEGRQKDSGNPNTRTDLFDKEGVDKILIQQRWYDADGWAINTRDYTDHGFPDDHPMVPHDHPHHRKHNQRPTRQSQGIKPNFEKFC